MLFTGIIELWSCLLLRANIVVVLRTKDYFAITNQESCSYIHTFFLDFMAHAVLRIRSLRTVQVGKLSLHDTSLFKYITLSAELPTYALLRVGVRALIA